MQNTTTIIIALFLVATLVFIVPIITLSGRVDNVAQENVKIMTEEFVTNIQNTGKVTLTDYQNFETRLATTGNKYNIDMELQILDENPGKKVSQSNATKIGENVYYSKYTTQILNELTESNNETILLKKGDRVNVEVKNENQTLAQTLKSAFYRIAGNSNYSISASSAGLIAIDGQ